MKKYLFLFFAIGFLASCNTEDKIYYALVETEYGNMKLELYNSTPEHRDNFIKLANEGFYNGLLFHRVMSGFMIQGGDPDSKGAAPGQRLGSGGPGYTTVAEIGAPHFKGALAAARTPDGGNPQKRSSGSQFYIVQGNPQSQGQLDNFARMKGFQYNEAQTKKYLEVGGRPDLDAEYTVFGEVVEGINVIDKIAATKTDRSDRPLEDIKMKVSLIK